MPQFNPLVSVIIPNYNHSLYLPERIESVTSQDFKDVEIIILDDCSSDNSQDIILRYAKQNSKIQTVFNNKNSGSVFKQWAKGLSLSRGKYIWIAESDDFAELNFLSTLVAILENNNSLSFAYTNSLVVDEKGRAKEEISELKKRIFSSDHWDKNFISDGKQELRQYLSLQCTVNNASAVLFRRSSIDAAGGVDTEFRYTGDWMMYIKLSLQGDIAYVAQCLNNYREHEVNASKKSFADGSQLYERQKCFAYVYKSKALDKRSSDIMVKEAANEYYELLYHVLQTMKQPLRMLKMVTQLSKISAIYCAQLQIQAIRRYRAVKTSQIWSKLIN